jgi:hypothetical protein
VEDHWLITYGKIEKMESVREKRLFGSKYVLEKVEYVAMKIFDINSNKMIADDALELKDFYGLNQLVFYDKSSTIYSKNDTMLVEKLSNLKYHT